MQSIPNKAKWSYLYFRRSIDKNQAKLGAITNVWKYGKQFYTK